MQRMDMLQDAHRACGNTIFSGVAAAFPVGIIMNYLINGNCTIEEWRMVVCTSKEFAQHQSTYTQCKLVDIGVTWVSPRTFAWHGRHDFLAIPRCDICGAFCGDAEEDNLPIACRKHAAVLHVAYLVYIARHLTKFTAEYYDRNIHGRIHPAPIYIWKCLPNYQDTELYNMPNKSRCNYLKPGRGKITSDLQYSPSKGVFMFYMECPQKNGRCTWRESVTLESVVSANPRRGHLAWILNSLKGNRRLTLSLPEHPLFAVLPRKPPLRCRHCGIITSPDSRLPLSVIMEFVCTVTRKHTYARPISALNMDTLHMVINCYTTLFCCYK